MDAAERRRQAELRAVYRDAWAVLGAWATCACPEDTCPLQEEMDRLGFAAGDLLAAVALGQPRLIGIAAWGAW